MFGAGEFLGGGQMVVGEASGFGGVDCGVGGVRRFLWWRRVGICFIGVSLYLNPGVVAQGIVSLVIGLGSQGVGGRGEHKQSGGWLK